MILTPRLILKKIPGDRLCLCFPIGFKLTFIGIGIFILVSAIVTTPGGITHIFIRMNIIPLVLSVILFLAACFHDRWIFDKQKDMLENQFGFTIFRIKRVLKISELAKVQLIQFVRGELPIHKESGKKKSIWRRPLISLSIVHLDGTIHRLEIYKAFHRKKVKHTAQCIAEYCSLPLSDKTQE